MSSNTISNKYKSKNRKQRKHKKHHKKDKHFNSEKNRCNKCNDCNKLNKSIENKKKHRGYNNRNYRNHRNENYVNDRHVNVLKPHYVYGQREWFDLVNSREFLEWEVINETIQTRIRAMKYGRLPDDEGDHTEQNYPRKRWYNAWEPTPN